VIERAYRTAEALGIPVWCQDEAGPYQALPQPGPSWQPAGQPAHIPHEYVRGGTAKLLTLFRPATGEVRARPVERAPNAVLHPWLRAEIEAILAALPPPESGRGPEPEPQPERSMAAWDWRERPLWDLATLPPVRALLIWDNLRGHQTPDLLNWLVARGVWPLFTPLGGSWLNLAESVQRILVRRALAGQHPHSAQEVMAWLGEAVAGWNAEPTPFAWGGKRAGRRQRARERRHALGGSGGYTRRPLPRTRRSPYDLPLPNGYTHVI
jgi:DDE superfamily endonuclease